MKKGRKAFLSERRGSDPTLSGCFLFWFSHK